MQKYGDQLFLSSKDLIGQLNCPRSTALDVEVANGVRSKPHITNSMLDRLRALGEEHENSYIQHLRDEGLDVVEVPGKGIDADCVQATKLAMRDGRQVIVQAAFSADNWTGRADVLLRVDKPSALGDWSYEAVDTKLSQNTKGNTVLQLCLYSELIAKVQETEPEHFHVVVPYSDFTHETFRFAEYAAYFRQAKRTTEAETTTSKQGRTTLPRTLHTLRDMQMAKSM